MSSYLSTSPPVLALLQEAREKPDEDGPRLVLADWLEDHGEPIRAEFIRLQCRLGGSAVAKDERESMEIRCEQLLDQHGGGWLGPLWQWSCSPLRWHRGLLSVRLPRCHNTEDFQPILPWIDTMLFVLHGFKGLLAVADALRLCPVNHVHLDLRAQMREGPFLQGLAQLPGSPCLRSLSVAWPMALLRRQGRSSKGSVCPSVSHGFLTTLLEKLPVGRHLTHLGSTHRFSKRQAQLIRQRGIEPLHSWDRLWMHRLPSTVFRAREHPLSSCQNSFS
jgi:uncharacterized protein (TIGR02996 family)